MALSKLLLPVAAASAAILYFWKGEAKAATVSAGSSSTGNTYPPYTEEETLPASPPGVEPGVSYEESPFFQEEENAASVVAEYKNPVATAYDMTPGDSRDDLAVTLADHLQERFAGSEDKRLVATFQQAVGIKVDGLYGPATRSALVTYLPAGWPAPPAAFYQGSSAA